jgi:restriction system protein
MTERPSQMPADRNNTNVTCSGCGAALVGPEYLDPPEFRVPCPECGSAERTVSVPVMAIGTAFPSVIASPLEGRAIVMPSLLLQAVVEAKAQTSEGNLIIALAPAWLAIVAELQKDPSIAFKLGWRKWEEIIAAAYERDGYEVILTPRSGDGGRDVIATSSGRGTVRILDQVKAHGPEHRVSANDVRALLGVLYSDSKASKGVVTTTSDFAPGIDTDPSIQPFVPTRLELVNGETLRTRLAEIASKKQRP